MRARAHCTTPRDVLARLRTAAKTMSPGYFSMVMATGILSLAAYLPGPSVLAEALYGLNWAFFVIVCALAITCVVWHPRHTLADLFDHLQAPGFFTFVAACAILASQTLLIGGNRSIAMLLAVVAPVAWVALTCTIFTVPTMKPALDRGINGGWLLVVLAVWRYAIKRFPFTYDPVYWGAVFRIGMCAVATLRLERAMHLPFRGVLPHAMFVPGCIEWVVLFAGQRQMLRRNWASGARD